MRNDKSLSVKFGSHTEHDWSKIIIIQISFGKKTILSIDYIYSKKPNLQQKYT